MVGTASDGRVALVTGANHGIGVAAALLIAESAQRHVARHGEWGRIIGLTSGEPDGFPEEVSYGAAKAAQVNVTLSAHWSWRASA